ncbi:hypothetical protein BTO20_33860 [Mycobacterium dioxanotrophicus]|uniref:Arsenate reductase n=1 Tax=Mycobacterium dioxanotrophicus TaxID=482462 RepID=A0A1Y0CCW0_9MYCO|nr:hypothetical protein BTO20_33860 [Mycobacterium dioxanotrophicus]
MAPGEVPQWVPQACTLPTAERPFRVAEFDRLFGESAVRWTRPNATRLDVVLDAVAEERARGLAAREAGCCSFFTFRFVADGTKVVMCIDVPASQSVVLDGLAARMGAAKRGGGA